MPIKKTISYDELLLKLGTGQKHLLLGNGFSISCDKVFNYSSLYNRAVSKGLSARAQQIFQRLGNSNFEGAMRLLDDSHWVANIYGFVEEKSSDMLSDVEIIKKTLIESVATSHLSHTGELEDSKKKSALTFLKTYHNIFTTNYDLLPYWINMYSTPKPNWQDGFRHDENNEASVVFSERLGKKAGMFFLHGALHLYVENGELRKHCWSRTGKPLTQLIQEGLDAKKYPLFIAEGSSIGKLEQIQRSGYLWYCLDKFARIENPLVIYGHALGSSDQHIIDALARNPKLKILAVSLYGDSNSIENQRIQNTAQQIQVLREEIKARSGGASLDVLFFNSESAAPWGTQSNMF